MNALQRAIMVGQFRSDTGSFVSDQADAVAKWLLPTIYPVAGLPRVPDGAVAGRPYIPPNVTTDYVLNGASLEKSMKRVVIVSAVGGLVAGVIGGYVAGRNKRS